MNTIDVQPPVLVCDQVPESSGRSQSLRQAPLYDSAIRKSEKDLAVRCGNGPSFVG